MVAQRSDIDHHLADIGSAIVAGWGA